MGCEGEKTGLRNGHQCRGGFSVIFRHETKSEKSRLEIILTYLVAEFWSMLCWVVESAIAEWLRNDRRGWSRKTLGITIPI